MTVLSLILFLVVVPALVGYCLYVECMNGDLDSSTISMLRGQLHRIFRGRLEPGDFLIYRKSKVSPRPGPRARNVQAAENGDDYYYEVDKFWIVSDVLNDGRLVAQTRTGKRVYLTPEDERLRKAHWFERVRYRRRFPAF
ncbi:MAG: hypothetical protein ABSE62_12520 [Chthoniobacteraceae bacterium]|jgi:hypothetical protein